MLILRYFTKRHRPPFHQSSCILYNIYAVLLSITTPPSVYQVKFVQLSSRARLHNVKACHYSDSDARGILPYPIRGSGCPPKILLNPSAIACASGERGSSASLSTLRPGAIPIPIGLGGGGASESESDGGLGILPIPARGSCIAPIRSNPSLIACASGERGAVFVSVRRETNKSETYSKMDL